MQTKIKKIAEIITSYTFRGRIENIANGEHQVVQAKDLVANENIDQSKSYPRVNITGKLTGILKEDDVLLTARGTSYRASLVSPQTYNLIASSSLHIIRVDQSKVNPAYLMYYLNSEAGQASITAKLSGNYIPALSRADLAEITIPLLDLGKQNTLISLCNNIAKQEKITAQANILKNQIITKIFKEI